MSDAVFSDLSETLQRIDRPGSFCASGSVPVVLPGLHVQGLGPIGLPLTARQAKELKKRCRQAPYGKGEQTLVDTSVRRVWQLTPDRFTLTNPEWEALLQDVVRQVQEELGLEKQKLESHLYDLLLYEPGSFFLPHRDGEKLERMVATLVLVLPSSFEGGELVIRHDGQEQTIDFQGDPNLFRIHYAAFYADCEHEVRPLRSGYRLCLVYNLTLRKGKKGLSAPRSAEYVEPVRQLLSDWAGDAAARRLVVTLEHQYTQSGLTWDTLKGVDRVRARVLREAAKQAGCQAYLGLLTFHEAGAAEDDGDYYERDRWHDEYEDEDEDEEDEEEEDSYDGEHVMGEVYETSLTADHWVDPDGRPLALGQIAIQEDELLDPDMLKEVEPEEEYEGYTGNAGMTLDRWYRHAAVFVWPNRKHFDVLCDAGGPRAVAALERMVNQLRRSSKKAAPALRADCIEFATAIIERWPENPYGYDDAAPAQLSPLLPALAALEEPKLVRAFLGEVLVKDLTIDAGKLLPKVCEKYGWATFQKELRAVFKSTTAESLKRNVRILEELCLAKPRQKAAWSELCETLGDTMLQALKTIDQEKRTNLDWEEDWDEADRKGPRATNRSVILAGLARALLLTEPHELLPRLVVHALSTPEKYPLTTAHVAALTALRPWLERNVKKPVPALSHWLAACCEQLEALTAEEPQPPLDLRRDAAIPHSCADCRELAAFLANPHEPVHRFPVREDRRRHLESMIRQHKLDLDFKTERRGSPYSLVCTKNIASYRRSMKKYHEEQKHLAMLRAIEAKLPG